MTKLISASDPNQSYWSANELPVQFEHNFKLNIGQWVTKSTTGMNNFIDLIITIKYYFKNKNENILICSDVCTMKVRASNS